MIKKLETLFNSDTCSIIDFIINSDAIENILYSESDIIRAIEEKSGYPYQHVKAIKALLTLPNEFNLQRAHKTLIPEMAKLHTPYRSCEVTIGGRYGMQSNKVPEAMFDLFKKEINTVEDTCSFHIKYEHIHPYCDGNGRTGRMLLASHLKQLKEQGIGKGPVLIHVDERFRYYDFIKYNDVEKFANFINEKWNGVTREDKSGIDNYIWVDDVDDM